MDQFKKTILISGTSKGIGKFLAEYYLGLNFYVIGFSRSKSTITKINYLHYIADICDEKEVNSMIFEISKNNYKVDYLINCAGIASMNHSLLTPYSFADKILRTNFLGTFLLSREVGKMMIKHKFGRIINFSSIATIIKTEGESVYIASKQAIESLTKTLSFEFAPFNITVNAIAPCPMETAMISNMDKIKLNLFIDKQTIKRFCDINDITNITDFFIDNMSSLITGQVIYLGGVQ